MPGDMSRKVVEAAVDERLTKMGTDRLDLLQLHWYLSPSPRVSFSPPCTIYFAPEEGCKIDVGQCTCIHVGDGAQDFIGKEFHFKNNLAMKFTTQNDPYKL